MEAEEEQKPTVAIKKEEEEMQSSDARIAQKVAAVTLPLKALPLPYGTSCLRCGTQEQRG